jgi:hypothetical protein
MSDDSTAPLTAHEALDCAIAILLRAQNESAEIPVTVQAQDWRWVYAHRSPDAT